MVAVGPIYAGPLHERNFVSDLRDEARRARWLIEEESEGEAEEQGDDDGNDVFDGDIRTTVDEREMEKEREMKREAR